MDLTPRTLFTSLLGLLLLSSTTHASPGLTTLNSGVDNSTGQYQTQIEDIKVKVQGGYIRITQFKGTLPFN